MTKRYQIYRCEVCGNIVQILHAGVGTLVCCNKSMKLLVEKKEEEGSEKHVPIVEKTENGIQVKVGSIPHPMEENHYIEWLEVRAGDKIYHKFLNPGAPPEAEFEITNIDVEVKEYCTVHGLWSA